jgi:hypothetical protein
MRVPAIIEAAVPLTNPARHPARSCSSNGGRGACFDSTEDVIDAADAAEAEELAIAAWRAARPGFTFQPLLTALRA